MTGSNFKDIRNEVGLTQEELAQVLGCSGRTIHRIEAQEDVPRVYAFAMLFLIVRRYFTAGRSANQLRRLRTNISTTLTEIGELMAKLVRQEDDIADALMLGDYHNLTRDEQIVAGRPMTLHDREVYLQERFLVKKHALIARAKREMEAQRRVAAEQLLEESESPT